MKKFEKYKQEFLDKLTSGDRPLTGIHLKIAEYIKQNYKKVSYMSVQELSSLLKIESTIVDEYLNNIGFKNYEEFRKALRKIITVELKTTDRFKISMEVNPEINSIFSTVIDKEIQNLNNMFNCYDERVLNSIVNEVLNAPEIIIVGTRASAPVAIYAEYIFNRIGRKAKKIISGGTENFDSLATADRNTLVLAFGFARYPKETVKILGFFRKRSFKIISVTDNTLSPLVPLSDLVFITPCESVSFTDFLAVPICLINAIVISVSQLDKENSLKYLNEFEDIAKDMGFYF